ncbi:L,D-transpeptidase [Cereibacter sphaeroides]|uniref:L,D-transpeptidase n=1 Tax=Rhodobacterales TaxID=204455 RepID=UPI000BBE0AE4|nr:MULTISPECIES: L,D-transpeptidase [Paracoccaceae]MCE6951998.1 L,D-transpeptidase [Cereibacter sphaeroides]MCE6961311.1 L,D-transpeptidase [Cereibacter sphaeroides]MCE6970297.1 L,D-transpeptidase [Cereibacter sphaeroides]MCE6972075.1 L,D-transpeptidase [Cereibacter sphaeroides]
MQKFNLRRRGLLSAAAAALTGLALAGGARAGAEPALRAPDWRHHFPSLGDGAILADLRERTVHFWAEDERLYRSFPASVPRAREFARVGGTRVIRKVEGPTWRPTPWMREREPHLPASVPPGPGNPFGSHALHLEWDHFRIHGTDDPARIGRETTLGCIGLSNEHIAELFALARVGTPVRLI